jgi:Coenzyme PQQ synthesis protein D (PqqD)
MKVVDDVILHEEDGEAFLLHVGSGQYYGLNKSGLIVWNALVRAADPVEQLQREWPNRSTAQLQSDADGLVNRLLQAGLLCEDADGSSP